MNNVRRFLLASIDRETGHLTGHRSYILYGACAIAVYELLKKGKLRYDDKRVSSLSAASEGDAFLDEVHKVIRGKSPGYKLRSLISYAPYRIKGIGRRLFDDLEDNGLVRIEQCRFLGLIPYNRYIITKTAVYDKLTNELKDIVMAGDRRAEQDKAFLITLLYECRVLRKLFDKEQKKKLSDTFRLIGKFTFFETLDVDSTAVLKAVKDAITASKAAVT